MVSARDGEAQDGDGEALRGCGMTCGSCATRGLRAPGGMQLSGQSSFTSLIGNAEDDLMHGRMFCGTSRATNQAAITA